MTDAPQSPPRGGARDRDGAVEWWYMDHRCPLCGEFWSASNYSHGYYADHMITVHQMHGQRPCDEDCTGCVSNRSQERMR